MWKQKLCLGTVGGAPLGALEQIRLFKEAGFDGFFMVWERGVDLGEIRKFADENAMFFQSVHAPFGRVDRLWEQTEETQDVLEEQLACVRESAAAGVPIVVCHAIIGFDKHTPSQTGVDNFRTVVEEARRLGVKLAFENTEGDEYLAMLLDAFKAYPNVGFCWDTGHEMCYNAKDMLALYGDRLIATHINDNLGIKDFDGKITWMDDLHLLPFDGIADWSDIAARLNCWGYDGVLTFELKIRNLPGRHENTVYQTMTFQTYLAEAYKRACRVATLKIKDKQKRGENRL